MSDRSWNDNPGKAPGTTVKEPEQGDGTASAWRKSNTPEMMVLFRFADGKQARAYPYSSLAGIDLDAGMIRLYFYEGTVTLLGRQLDQLGEYLSQHRVRAVLAQHCSEFEAGEDDTYIDKISIREPNVEALARDPA